MFKQGKEKIKRDEARIDEELQLIGNSQDVKQTANKIADIVEDGGINRRGFLRNNFYIHIRHIQIKFLLFY